MTDYAHTHLRRIVIVGGGTAGWLTAAMLGAHLPHCELEVVEAEDIGIVGVGESTIPPFVRLLQKLGIDEQEFVARTGGCYKLGILFDGWRTGHDRYFHPFGVIGRRIANRDFYQCWLKASQSGSVPPLMAFSPCAELARAQRFYPPSADGGAPTGASYALHMDAGLAVDYLKAYAQKRGVRHRQGTVLGATRRDNGHIEALQLESGARVEGDFYIDCTGFRASLAKGIMGTAFEDWGQWLPCDRAISVKTETADALVPFTRATARKAGWSWRIPLRTSTGHGYVYSSRHCSDAQAKSTLMANLDARRTSEPKLMAFRPGHRTEFWTHNCLAVGLSSGFLEPLESTSIHLIARGVEFFLRYLPSVHCEEALAREYNRRMTRDFEEIRDFLMLHYTLSERRDTPFWRDCSVQPLPESLRERVALFRAGGGLREGVDDLFRATSWQAVFEGMGVRPARCHPQIDALDSQTLAHELQLTRRAVQSLVNGLPAHDAVLPDVMG
ncbi:tryptophan halogenase family protein [Marinimicrobium sp. ARAG 43.8]|uniref:tryptophan halogenase family protein n=1 Tax=Marinimicrobium sp. ARAG 43.8 TaxID=3418719 RepID=UPI003CF65C21